MERNRTVESSEPTPREKLLKNFKIAVAAFEKHIPDHEKFMNAEELFEERKRRMSSLRRSPLTDEEFIDDWMTFAPVPPYNAYEIGKALGEMKSEVKTPKQMPHPRQREELVRN